MDFFRNREVKTELLTALLLTVLFSGIGFWLSPACGILVICVSLLFILLHFLTARRRYRRLAELSLEIDRILHGEETDRMQAYAEGELAILQNEISKMTIRLKVQSEALLQDKRYLADSITDISHQLRTPLTSMNLIVSMMSRGERTEERRRELTQELSRLLARIDWQIRALLKISKLDAGTAYLRQDQVSVTELVNKAAAPLLIPLELRDQHLTLHLEENAHFLGDLSWSAEALGNVLMNCMEHTPAGGTLEIHASENSIYTELMIMDNGSGILPEDLPHLFERFYKGKNADESSVGVGLALARMIVTSQNGTIQAENRPQGGACFTIRFYKGIV